MAKNHKFILGSGIAISPEKDMALFKKMSEQGWHLNGTLLWWYRFHQGEPTDYDYASNMELKVTKEMLSIYKDSGWMPIIAVDGFQIFRAKAGTTPIFSDRDSEIEALEETRHNMFKAGIIWSITFLCIMSARLTIFNDNVILGGILTILSTLISIPAVINIIGFIGVNKMLKNKRIQTNIY